MHIHKDWRNNLLITLLVTAKICVCSDIVHTFLKIGSLKGCFLIAKKLSYLFGKKKNSYNKLIY